MDQQIEPIRVKVWKVHKGPARNYGNVVFALQTQGVTDYQMAPEWTKDGSCKMIARHNFLLQTDALDW